MANRIVIGDRKFNRKFELRIQKTASEDYVVIKPPFTVEVQVERNMLSSQNTVSLRIYNLSEDSRNQIQKDSSELGLFKRMEMKAGYGKNLYTIFSGNVYSAYSIREGVDFVTSVDGFDGGYAMNNSIVSKTIAAGATNKKIVETLTNEMVKFDVKKGNIGEILGSTTRGISLEGKTYERLAEITQGKVFIDNGRLNVLSFDEYVAGVTPIISSKSGLLGTPRMENTRVFFTTIFEPRLSIGQKITVKSTTQRKLINGRDYKIFSLKHSGVFSESVSGTMITEIGSLYGLKGWRSVA